MDYSNQIKVDIENALAEFIKLKTNKSEDEVVNLSKKFLSQLDEKLSNKIDCSWSSLVNPDSS